MNADSSPTLAASNTIETLAPQNIFEAAKVEDKIEAELSAKASAFYDTVETDIIAPVENFVAAAEAEVKKVYEKIREVTIHPEVGQTRPVINTNLPQGGGSVLKNPA